MAKHEQDQLIVTNPTDEYFEWPWAGQPYGIQPRQRIIWPRFLAEHYAKHLADKILLRKEQADKEAYLAKGNTEKDYRGKSYLNSKKERPPVIDSIILGVYNYFQSPRKNDPNAEIQRQIDHMNPQQNPNEPKPLDLGAVEDDRATGVLQDEAQLINPEDIDEGPAQQQHADVLPGQTEIPIEQPKTKKTKRSRQQLFDEAQQLGLKVNKDMSTDDVEQMIKKFYG